MYVRIARFDGGERDWDEFAAGLDEGIRSGASGTPLEAVTDVIERVLLLVDRDANRGANIVMSETKEGIERIDAALNSITPAGGRGARTGVDIYEVLVDAAPPK